MIEDIRFRHPPHSFYHLISKIDMPVSTAYCQARSKRPAAGEHLGVIRVMEGSPGTRPKHIDRRNLIRKYAAQVFAMRGYSGASLQEVSDILGITKAALYYYYKSKEDVLFDILSFADDGAWREIKTAAGLDANPIERVGHIVRAHVTWHLLHLNIAKVVFRDWNRLTGEALDVQMERRRRYSHFLRDHIVDCRSAGLIQAELSITMLTNFINGTVAAAPSWFAPEEAETPESVGEYFGKAAIAMLLGFGREKMRI